ncbi:MAG: L-rhamnose/proton symporter RhaT [Saprospiraceae bacterium]|nr:L-rhamnose/proton symporter RhaT [Saprospiraceae bacterium]
MGSILGILFHALGGFAAGSFYIPIKQVKGWHWESAWMILGIAAWVISPILFAYLTVDKPLEVIAQTDISAFAITYIFGVLWGIGGLTFGLSMRYLGISLGMTVALGLCTAFGTLIPPIFNGTFTNLIHTDTGFITLIGILLCLVGIIIVGFAGVQKEKQYRMENNVKTSAIHEFDFKKGLLVAIISGILSACFAFGLEAGKPIAELTSTMGTNDLFKNNVLLVYILLGGITSNGIYSLFLNYRKKSFSDYTIKTQHRNNNYIWAMLGGITWYLQFFFYGMGTTYIGKNLEFASWSIHMAFIILISNLWGIYYHEWQGVAKKTNVTLVLGLTVVLASILLIGLASTISTYL